MGDLSEGPQIETEVTKDVEFVVNSEENGSGTDKGYFRGLVSSKSAKQVIAVCLIGAMLAGGSVYYYRYKNTGYSVKYQGQFLGYVRDREAAVEALDKVKEQIKKYDASIDLNDDLEFEKVIVTSDKVTEAQNIVKSIESGLYIEYTCFAIMLNGKEFAIVGTEEEANKVVEGVKEHFKAEEAKTGAEVLSVSIKDDIKVEKRIVDSSKISDAKTILDTLLAGKGVTKKYEVKSGDSIWRIAKNNDMGIEEITAVNQGLDIERLQIGQLINLSVSEPYLNVEATVKATYDEKIPYDTKYVKDDKLYKGQSRLVEAGQYGINKIVKQITKLNGKEIASSVLNSAIVKEPVTRVMAQGTKQLIGSGKFLWPTNGRITSSFASRGGSHGAIDIGAPKGTPIAAADSGTVVYAGWYYGYGYLVRIDHGNGYETYYGHCSAMFVKSGDTVKRGQHIANVGSTGRSTGPHLHFEVRLGGIRQNPLKYLK